MLFCFVGFDTYCRMLNTLLDLPLGEVGSDLRQRDRHFSGSKGALRIQSTGAGGSGILLPGLSIVMGVPLVIIHF